VKEWAALVQEARTIGLSIEEVRTFLGGNEKMKEDTLKFWAEFAKKYREDALKEAELMDLARAVVEQAEENAAANPTSAEIQVVIVEPFKRPYKKLIPNTLEAMQEIVGGYIEHVSFATTKRGARLGIILNEEGKLIGLPANRIIHGKGGSDVFAGTFYITAHNLEGDSISLTNEECEYYIRQFAPAEVYL
jgi:hypothetical protein